MPRSLYPTDSNTLALLFAILVLRAEVSLSLIFFPVALDSIVPKFATASHGAVFSDAPTLPGRVVIELNATSLARLEHQLYFPESSTKIVLPSLSIAR